MRTIKLFIGLLIMTLATSCATDYTCGQYPSSGCEPISNVHERTKGDIHDYRQEMYSKSREDDDSEKSKGKGKRSRVYSSNVRVKAIRPLDPGNPIMKKPEVMRVYFTEWVDEENDLNTGGFTYIKLRDAEWSHD